MTDNPHDAEDIASMRNRGSVIDLPKNGVAGHRFHCGSTIPMPSAAVISRMRSTIRRNCWLSRGIWICRSCSQSCLCGGRVRRWRFQPEIPGLAAQTRQQGVEVVEELTPRPGERVLKNTGPSGFSQI